MPTSPVDHVARPRRHRGQVVLSAVAMVVALLGASALVLLSYSYGRVHAGGDASSLSVDTLAVFDASSPALQVSTATVINKGATAVQIDHISFTLTTPSSAAVVGSSSPPPTVPLVVFPGENCTGAIVPPNGYCAVSVRYTNSGRFSGFLVVTAHDGSTTSGPTGTLPVGNHLDSIQADPYVVDFGTRPVGTTSPAQTVTIGAAPSGNGYQVVGVSVVDTVPTPGDKADYQIATDGCTGADLRPIIVSPIRAQVQVPNCAITVTDTPGGVGDRRAFLSVAYCSDTTNTGSDFQPAASAPSSSAPPSSSSAPPSSSSQPPLDPNVFCPTGNHVPAFHQLVSLTGAGQGSTKPTPPPTTTTTAPPTTTTPPTTPPTFTPTVSAIPPLAPAGRTTLVSGTGFPPGTLVTYALVPPNTDPTIDLSTVPGFATATTDGSGAFANQILVLLPHTPAGEYEILATALFGRVPVTASVGFLVVPGSQQPPKFVDRH